MTRTFVVCIAGGSGSGKSTLTDALAARFGPDAASVLRLDDYQRRKAGVPMTASGRRNYDHPSALEWDAFLADLGRLKNGHDVTVQRQLRRRAANGAEEEPGTVRVPARPLVLVDGYLALHRPEARARYDGSVFLQASKELRVARRQWLKDDEYVREVLLPMHEHFVEPSAEHAGLVIAVDGQTPEQVLAWAVTYVETACAQRGAGD